MCSLSIFISPSGAYTVRSLPYLGGRISTRLPLARCTWRLTWISRFRKSISLTFSAAASPSRRPPNAHRPMNATKCPSALANNLFTSSGVGIRIAAEAAVLAAINDLRVGSSYATPTVIALHPDTLTYLKSQKDEYGRYLLNPTDPTEATANSVWGTP